MPPLGLVPLQTVRTSLRAPERERAWSLLELIADNATLAVMDRLAMGYLRIILREWETECEITINELFRLVTIIANPRQREALQADLIKAGMRLRNFPSEEHTWGDLKIFIRHLDVHTSLYGVVYPDNSGWDRQNLLLANISDSLTWLQWAKTKDGRKGRNRPKPIPRPGVQAVRSAGSKVPAAPLSQIKDRMAKRHADNNNAAQKNQLTAGLGRRKPVLPARKPTLDEIFGRR